MMLNPGTRSRERALKYRIGADQLLTDGDGESRIPVEDHAVAMIDEVEAQRHSRARFTVAYEWSYPDA